ncbi:unnamed protein product [Rodentolepis nana]|uniref:Uncharacterized protein n=1 Tax=Rodentolepis nana TaxID=102285 RepID=A0A0R3T7I2_RODNA|nr:unnamed protein product [Rodentolepis nana]
MDEIGNHRRRFIIFEVPAESTARSLEELLNEPPEASFHEDSRVGELLGNRGIDHRHLYTSIPEEFMMPNFDMEFPDQSPNDEHEVDPLEFLIIVFSTLAYMLMIILTPLLIREFLQSSVT